MQSEITSSALGQSLVIRNGQVIDPANQIDTKADVMILNGKIEAVGVHLVVPDGHKLEEFDARGYIVTPGLVDCHVHVYEHATVLGANPDRCCLSRGVTTVVDAGSTGAGTFTGLCKYVAEQSQCQVLAFIHIAAHGLAASGCSSGGVGGECDSLNQVNVDQCVQCITANRDLAVGVKIRLSTDVQNDGANEQEAYRRALAAASHAQVPLMVHHTFSTIHVEQGPDDQLSCPGSLRKGDIYTHTFHPYPSTIIDTTSRKIIEDVHKARRKGVLFDVGHGQGSFSWTVAEICAREDFWPDIISSDLHSGNAGGPAYDLPTVMSKLLHVGMPLYEVIKATTSAPAAAIGRSNVLGSLSPGSTADVAVFELRDVDIKLEDCQGKIRKVRKLLAPVAVWREGRRCAVTQPDPFPNPNNTTDNSLWEKAVI